jgi:hypothetical protein
MREEFVVLRIQYMQVLWYLLTLPVVHWAKRNRLIGSLSEDIYNLVRRLLRRSIRRHIALIIKAVMLKDIPC